MSPIDVVIAGGGTAGHTNPGIAVAEALVKKGMSSESILFVGSSRGSEGELVPKAGFQIETLAGRGVARKISFTSLKSALSLLKGIGQGIKLIFSTKPKVVLSLGGYAAMPASVGAILRRIPIVVTEQNARASSTNKILSKFASNCALPFAATDLEGEVTGNPIRSSILEPDLDRRLQARASLRVADHQRLIAVWSGSLGARSVNKAVADLAELVLDRPEYFIYHVIGKRDYPEYANKGGKNYRVIEYETNMQRLLSAADVAVCRAGASTVCELAIAGVPSILVPLPGAPKDHQTANAKELEKDGAAIVVSDAELSGVKLLDILDEITEIPQTTENMSRAALSVARPDAANAVADMLNTEGGLGL